MNNHSSYILTNTLNNIFFPNLQVLGLEFRGENIVIGIFFHKFLPMWGPGGQIENVSSVSPACRKRRLNGAVSRNNRIKRLAPCSVLGRAR